MEYAGPISMSLGQNKKQTSRVSVQKRNANEEYATEETVILADWQCHIRIDLNLVLMCEIVCVHYSLSVSSKHFGKEGKMVYSINEGRVACPADVQSTAIARGL